MHNNMCTCAKDVWKSSQALKQSRCPKTHLSVTLVRFEWSIACIGKCLYPLPNSHVETLTSSTSEYDCIWKRQGL